MKNKQTGAAMVEFALIVPLLLLLVVGIAEIGYAFYHLNTLNKSVQDGAQYFSESLIARNGGPSNDIDISASTNGDNIQATQCLIIFGDTTGSGSPLMPTTGSCTASKNNPVTVGNYRITLSSPIANHIQVTAIYQHQFILGSAVSNFIPALGSTGSINLTASTVLRVE